VDSRWHFTATETWPSYRVEVFQSLRSIRCTYGGLGPWGRSSRRLVSPRDAKKSLKEKPVATLAGAAALATAAHRVELAGQRSALLETRFIKSFTHFPREMK